MSEAGPEGGGGGGVKRKDAEDRGKWKRMILDHCGDP